MPYIQMKYIIFERKHHSSRAIRMNLAINLNDNFLTLQSYVILRLMNDTFGSDFDKHQSSPVC